MRTLHGIVKSRHGLASTNLRKVEHLIQSRMGLPTVFPGTLNVNLEVPYIVLDDARIEQDEYDNLEFLKLQRCRVRGLRCCIMRPNKHEEDRDAVKVLEIMSEYYLRSHLGLRDGDHLDVEVEGDDAWWLSPA